jgi:hypothetical protein
MADDELSHRRAVDRAARAKALVDDPLLKEAFDSFQNELMTLWVGTKADATAERERIWVTIRALGKIRAHLGNVIENGKVSTAVLSDMLGRTAA